MVKDVQGVAWFQEKIDKGESEKAGVPEAQVG